MRLIELRGADDAAIVHEAWRQRTASVLRAASALLARLAERIALSRAARRRRPELEFYAEAGAPEGALYVDGQWAGTLTGVRRL